MSKIKEDEVRENRILMEVVVDAYDEEERAMGWYYYLSDELQFPFKARCIVERRTSPLGKGEEVEVLDIASVEECMHEMFVKIKWKERTLAIPLSQIETLDDVQEPMEDWHYWVARGYQF